MVILKCCGAGHFFLERVVFPFELLSFEAPPQATVEVWTHGLGGPELCERHEVEELTSDSEDPAAGEP